MSHRRARMLVAPCRFHMKIVVPGCDDMWLRDHDGGPPPSPPEQAAPPGYRVAFSATFEFPTRETIWSPGKK